MFFLGSGRIRLDRRRVSSSDSLLNSCLQEYLPDSLYLVPPLTRVLPLRRSPPPLNHSAPTIVTVDSSPRLLPSINNHSGILHSPQ